MLTSNTKDSEIQEETTGKEPERKEENNKSEEKGQVICIGCCKEDPPKSLGSKKKVACLACDLCDKWWHCVCAGYTEGDAEKIIKAGIRFPCAVCILQQPHINKITKDNTTVRATDTDTKIDKLLEITKSLGQGYLDNKTTGSSPKENIPNTAVEKSDPEKIVIIDNIEQSKLIRDSTTIRKELTKLNVFEDQIEEANSLQRGGFAVHLKDKKKNTQR